MERIGLRNRATPTVYYRITTKNCNWLEFLLGNYVKWCERFSTQIFLFFRSEIREVEKKIINNESNHACRMAKRCEYSKQIYIPKIGSFFKWCSVGKKMYHDVSKVLQHAEKYHVVFHRLYKNLQPNKLFVII